VVGFARHPGAVQEDATVAAASAAPAAEHDCDTGPIPALTPDPLDPRRGVCLSEPSKSRETRAVASLAWQAGHDRGEL